MCICIYIYNDIIYESGSRIPGPPPHGMVPQAHALGNTGHGTRDTGPYIHTYIHTYRHTDRQTDRHTYIHTYTYIYILLYKYRYIRMII